MDANSVTVRLRDSGRDDRQGTRVASRDRCRQGGRLGLSQTCPLPLKLTHYRRLSGLDFPTHGGPSAHQRAHHT